MEMVSLTSRTRSPAAPRMRAGAQGSLHTPWACPKGTKSVVCCCQCPLVSVYAKNTHCLLL